MRRSLSILVSLAVAAVGTATAVVAGRTTSAAFSVAPVPRPTAVVPTTLVPEPAPPAPSTTAAPAPPEDRRVFVVGDSLTVGTRPWLADALAARGWRLVGVDARVGRHTAEGLAVLERDLAAVPPTATVVLALGTNDLDATHADVVGWIRAARRMVAGRRLLWVGLHLDDAQAPRLARWRLVNAALAGAASRAGVELVDWDGWARRRRLATRHDGIHYDDAAYRSRAECYAAALVAPPRVRGARA